MNIENLKKKLWIQYERIKDKGHERLTIMIIPHGESHIFNLQLSKFSIVFTALIMLAVIVASTLAWNFQQSLEPEVEQLKTAKNEVLQERLLYIRRLDRILEQQAYLDEATERIFQATALEETPNLTYEMLEELAENQLRQESKEFIEKMIQLQETENKVGLSLTSIQNQLLAEFKKSQLDANFQYNNDVRRFRAYRLKLASVINELNILYSYLSERIRVQRTLPYKWPLSGGHITSLFGLRISPFGYSTDYHTGIDIANSVGTPVYSAGSGTVIAAGWGGGYGNRVIIRHDFGFETVYGHMSRILVRPGMRVHKGMLIGKVGQTGRATGPHLHFEVRLQNKPLNPFSFITSGT